jgi:hypothetical protein
MENVWAGRARREASAVLAGAECVRNGFYSYDDLVTLCAVSWLQGANYGAHETLSLSEEAFDALKASL